VSLSQIWSETKGDSFCSSWFQKGFFFTKDLSFMIFTKLLHEIEFCYEIQKSDDNDEFDEIMMMKKIFSNIKQHQHFYGFSESRGRNSNGARLENIYQQFARLLARYLNNKIN